MIIDSNPQYNFEESLSRIDQMLNLQIGEEETSAQVPILTELPTKGGVITNCSVMQIEIASTSAESCEANLRVLRTFLSEAVAILASHKFCVDIIVLGTRLTGVFSTPFKINIEALIDKVVPVGAEVVQRAPCDHAADGLAVLAERDAAVHAAARLLFSLVFVQRCVEFVVGLDPFHGIDRRVFNSSVFQKSACLTHMDHPLTLSWKALILASSSSQPKSLYLAMASIMALYS